MSQGKKVLRCLHCGAPIQTTDKSLFGYISPDRFADLSNKSLVHCDKCYKEMMEINAAAESVKIDENIIECLKEAVKEKSLIVWVIDLFSFSGYLPERICEVVKKTNFIVIGTHKDLFLKPFKETKIKDFINYCFNENGLKPLDILCIDGKNIKDCMIAEKYAREHYLSNKSLDMYILGEHGCGKTVMVSTFFKIYKNPSNREVSGTRFKETDMLLLGIPLSKNRTMYEIPGYSNTFSIQSKVEKEIHKYIVPKHYLKVTPFILNTNQAVVLGSLGIVEVKESVPTTFRFYTAEGIEMVRTQISNVRKIMDTNVFTKIRRPVSSRYTKFQDFELLEFVIEKDEKLHEIAVEGFFFMTFKGRGQKIWICVPKGSAVHEGIGRY